MKQQSWAEKKAWKVRFGIDMILGKLDDYTALQGIFHTWAIKPSWVDVSTHS